MFLLFTFAAYSSNHECIGNNSTHSPNRCIGSKNADGRNINRSTIPSTEPNKKDSHAIVSEMAAIMISRFQNNLKGNSTHFQSEVNMLGQASGCGYNSLKMGGVKPIDSSTFMPDSTAALSPFSSFFFISCRTISLHSSMPV